MVDASYLAPGPATGHFIQMSHDINPRIGCAMVIWEIPEDLAVQKHTKVTCNYFKSPYGGEPLYMKGDPCTGPNCFQCNEELRLCNADLSTFDETYMQPELMT